MSSGQGTGYCDQVWSKSNVGKYVKKMCCQKERKQKEERGKGKETSKKQYPAAAPAGWEREKGEETSRKQDGRVTNKNVVQHNFALN